jgi:flagellar biosynthesis protein FlhG
MHEELVINDQAARLREIALQASPRSESSQPATYVVASGKGGVGKSTLALNLSLALSDLGKRVLLVDGDHQMGNIMTLLGMTSQYGLSDVLRGERDIEDVLVQPHPHLDVLPGSSGDERGPWMTPSLMKGFINSLKNMEEPYDYLFIDLSAGLSPEIITACVEADEDVVLTSSEPTSVMDAYALIKMIVAQRPLQTISVVVSAAESPVMAAETFEKLQLAVQHFLHTEIRSLVSIPYDKLLKQSVEQQLPLLRMAPSSASALSIAACARKMTIQHSVQYTGHIQ